MYSEFHGIFLGARGSALEQAVECERFASQFYVLEEHRALVRDRDFWALPGFPVVSFPGYGEDPTLVFASKLARTHYAWVRGNGLEPFSKETINRKIARANRYAHIRERLEGIPPGSLWRFFLCRDKHSKVDTKAISSHVTRVRLSLIEWELVPYDFVIGWFDPRS